ncbi:hypothetical protein GCM10027176_62490 [Actinoallomurus bryophytorum]
MLTVPLMVESLPRPPRPGYGPFARPTGPAGVPPAAAYGRQALRGMKRLRRHQTRQVRRGA